MSHAASPLTDEDLCAVLDGEAPDDLVERVRSDPRAQHRLDELRTASLHLRGAMPLPLDPDTVDDLIARAVAEAPVASPPSVATTLPARRSGGAPRWLVAAVVIALAAVGLGLVWSGTRPTGRGPVASAPDDALDDSADAERRSIVDQLAPLAELGSHPDIAALRSSLRTGLRSAAGLDRAPTEGAPGRDGVARCAIQVAELLESENPSPTPAESGVATVDGQIVLVYEFDLATADHEALVSIVTPDDCDPAATFYIG